eukprot:4014126-Prymnesium_polylepis.1
MPSANPAIRQSNNQTITSLIGGLIGLSPSGSALLERLVRDSDRARNDLRTASLPNVMGRGPLPYTDARPAGTSSSSARAVGR